MHRNVTKSIKFNRLIIKQTIEPLMPQGVVGTSDKDIQAPSDPGRNIGAGAENSA